MRWIKINTAYLLEGHVNCTWWLGSLCKIFERTSTAFDWRKSIKQFQRGIHHGFGERQKELWWKRRGELPEHWYREQQLRTYRGEEHQMWRINDSHFVCVPVSIVFFLFSFLSPNLCWIPLRNWLILFLQSNIVDVRSNISHSDPHHPVQFTCPSN